VIENVILTVENCRYCLMCRHVCPVAHVTRKETLTPHGWGLTIASVKRGLLDWNSDSVDVLYSCADCGTCRAHCVTDQPLPQAIAAARAEVVAGQKAPAAAYEIHGRLLEWGNPYGRSAPPPSGEQASVALFVGDDAWFAEPESLQAAERLLTACGLRAARVGVGRNNGYLASSLGFPETAAALIAATMEEVVASGAETMLVLGPGDYHVFTQLLDERLGLSWPAGVAVQEAVTFLSDRLAAGELNVRRAPPGPPWAYVDPTHTVRLPWRSEAPRRLLAAAVAGPGRELFWRRERAHPSGNVALQYTSPHIADHLTYSRLADVRQSGAQVAITDDPGTLAALRRHAGRFGLELRGLYELLAGQLA
jgi:Fe-S oxidoreductase